MKSTSKCISRILQERSIVYQICLEFYCLTQQVRQQIKRGWSTLTNQQVSILFLTWYQSMFNQENVVVHGIVCIILFSVYLCGITFLITFRKFITFVNKTLIHHSQVVSTIYDAYFSLNFFSIPDQVALRIHSLDLNPGEVLNIYDGLSTADKKIVKLTNDVTNMPVVYAKQMR